MAWSCEKQLRISDCGSQSAAERLKGTSAAESSTAADGSFSLAALPAGKYKLTIVAGGTTATLRAANYFDLGLTNGSDHNVE